MKSEIKALRKQTGLSQAAFAQYFGLLVRSLQQWEQGRSASQCSGRALPIDVMRAATLTFMLS